MRDYGKVAPTFWTRGSGKALRGDHAAQVIALYLMTCPNATMTGIYYLPLPTLAHETGMTTQGASEALGRVIEAGLAEYDEAAEMVWVPNLARYQVGAELKAGDKRIQGLPKALEASGNHRFVQAFYDLYSEAYKLPKRKAPPSPHEGPSDPLLCQKQDQEQNQKQDQNQNQKQHTHSPGARAHARVTKPPAEATQPEPTPAPRPTPPQPWPPPAGPTTPRDPVPAPADAEPASAATRAILAELRRHPALALVATVAAAERQAAHVEGGAKALPWVVAAIADLGGKAGGRVDAGMPWDLGTLSDKLWSFCANAKPPRDGEASAAPAPARSAAVAPPLVFPKIEPRSPRPVDDKFDRVKGQTAAFLDAHAVEKAS